jgi:AcrR family transcriptional regulator
MSIVVEYDKRRNEILEKALDVFMDEGFEDTTFQKISDRCGITRTTLYLYFKNKKEIFNYSIKLMLLKVEEGIRHIQSDASIDTVEKIIRVMLDIIDQLQKNRRILIVVLDYLLYLSRSDADPDLRVRRRTIRMRHILSSLIIEGIDRNELAPVDVKIAVDYLYSILESAIFRLIILKHAAVDELKQAAIQAVQRLRQRR